MAINSWKNPKPSAQALDPELMEKETATDGSMALKRTQRTCFRQLRRNRDLNG
jgi:hypothetical protein